MLRDIIISMFRLGSWLLWQSYSNYQSFQSLESTLGIICASAGALRPYLSAPFWSKIRLRLRRSRNQDTAGTTFTEETNAEKELEDLSTCSGGGGDVEAIGTSSRGFTRR